MTISEVETSSKVLATHRYRSAVVYVRQSVRRPPDHPRRHLWCHVVQVERQLTHRMHRDPP